MNDDRRVEKIGPGGIINKKVDNYIKLVSVVVPVAMRQAVESSDKPEGVRGYGHYLNISYDR